MNRGGVDLIQPCRIGIVVKCRKLFQRRKRIKLLETTGLTAPEILPALAEHFSEYSVPAHKTRRYFTNFDVFFVNEHRMNLTGSAAGIRIGDLFTHLSGRLRSRGYPTLTAQGLAEAFIFKPLVSRLRPQSDVKSLQAAWSFVLGKSAGMAKFSV